MREIIGILQTKHDVDWYQVKTMRNGSFLFTLDCNHPGVKVELFGDSPTPLCPDAEYRVPLQKGKTYFLKVCHEGSGHFGPVKYTVSFTGDLLDWSVRPQLAAGTAHTLALKEDGTVWAWGDNSCGQLGDGTDLRRYEQQRVPGLNDVTMVFATGNSSFAVKSDGTVWGWGYNEYLHYFFGNENANTYNQKIPIRVLGLDNVVQLSCGSDHCLALREDGSVWAWGYNENGKVGGNFNKKASPVPNLPKISQVFAGATYSMALATNGDLWLWGQYTPFYNTANGLQHISNSTLNTPGRFAIPFGISRIEAGCQNHLFIRKDDGLVYAWGNNSNRQLGLEISGNRVSPEKFVTARPISSMATNATFSLAVLDDGSVWSWGKNQTGALGTSDIDLDQTAITPMPVNSVKKVIAITAGASHSAALTDDGKLYMWGSNSNGQLSDRTLSYSVEPILMDKSREIRSEATKVLISNPLREICGVLDNVSDVEWYCIKSIRNANFKLTVESDNAAATFELFDNKSALIRPDHMKHVGLIKDREYFLRISHNTSYKDITTTTQYTVTFEGNCNEWIRRPMVAAGSKHSIVLMEDGTVWTWGTNTSGQLGDGTTVQKTVPQQVPNLTRVKMICACAETSYALREDGTVWAWGMGSSYQLGNGKNTNSLVPVQVLCLTDIVYISCNATNACAVKNDGTLWVWGSNAKLGNYSKTTPTCIIDIPKVSQVFAGTNVIIALAINGDMWTVGTVSPFNSASINKFIYTFNGISNYPQRFAQPCAVSAIEADCLDHLLIRGDDGRVYGWGTNTNYVLGAESSYTLPMPLYEIGNIQRMATSANHSFAILDNGEAWGWGYNYLGKLGVEEFPSNSVAMAPLQITGLQNVVSISAADNHSLAVCADGSMWAWGSNASLQLGFDDTSSHIPKKLEQKVITADRHIDLYEEAETRDLGVGANTLFLGIADSPEDADWFSFRTKQSGDYTMEVISKHELVLAVLYDDNLDEIKANEDGLYSLDADCVYYIKSSTAATEAFVKSEYAILVTQVTDDYDAHPNRFDEASLIALPLGKTTKLNGNVQYTEDEDWFVINSQAKSTCKIDFKCDNPDVRLDVYDQDLAPIRAVNNKLELDSGKRHYLHVRYKPNCEDALYSIDLTNEAYEDGDTPDLPAFTDCKILPIDKITVVESKLHDCGDTDWYCFKCPEKALIEMGMSCDEDKVYFDMYDEHMRPILTQGYFERERNQKWYVKVSGNSTGNFITYKLDIHPRSNLMILKKDKSYFIAINGTSVNSVKSTSVLYDPAKIKMLNFAAHAAGSYTTAGKIPNTDLEIKSHNITEGELKFAWNKEIPEGEVCDTLVTLMEFVALDDGVTKIRIN